LAVLVVTLWACGGDDDSVDPGPADDGDVATADPAGDEANAQTDDGGGDDGAGDVAQDVIDGFGSADSGTATVTFDGTTYEFALLEPGPEDDFYSFCSQVAGSLQAVMQQVDETGAYADGQLTVLLAEPGGAFERTGDPPEIYVDVDGRSLNNIDGENFDATSDGSSGGGAVTLYEMTGFDDSGQMQQAEYEATLEVSC
jgi:hypothetical protein